MAKRAAPKPTTEIPEVVRANINRETVAGENYVSLYVNDTQVQVSPWDFRFLLGVIQGLPTEENPKILIKQIGEIRMSPQHAKKVAQVLAGQIELYERLVGPIPLPQD
jgi:hypothetical protein